MAGSLLESNSRRTDSGIILLKWEDGICITTTLPVSLVWRGFVSQSPAWHRGRDEFNITHTSGKPLQPGTLQSSRRMERLIRSCPEVPELWEHLGCCHIPLGNADPAQSTGDGTGLWLAFPGLKESPAGWIQPVFTQLCSETLTPAWCPGPVTKNGESMV